MALDLRPLTLAELLDRSFSTYKHHVWLFVGIMAVPAAFALVYSILLQLLQFSNGPLPVKMTADEAFRRILPMMIAAGLFAVIYMAVYAFALGATTIAVAHLFKNETIGVADTYRAVRPQGWRLILLLVWVSVRLMLAWIGLTIIAGLLAALVGLISPILSALVFVLGMAVSFVAIALFAIRYGVCVPAAVLENLGPSAALRRSVDLTQGHRGRIFLVLLCAIVITYATGALLQGPFMVGAIVAGPGTVTSLVLNVIGAVLGTAGSTFSGPIMIIGLALAYYDLRIRKEALDLQMMLDAIDRPRA
jgi:hypothetical protein